MISDEILIQPHLFHRLCFLFWENVMKTLFIYLFIYLFICLFIYLFMYTYIPRHPRIPVAILVEVNMKNEITNTTMEEYGQGWGGRVEDKDIRLRVLLLPLVALRTSAAYLHICQYCKSLLLRKCSSSHQHTNLKKWKPLWKKKQQEYVIIILQASVYPETFVKPERSFLGSGFTKTCGRNATENNYLMWRYLHPMFSNIIAG